MITLQVSRGDVNADKRAKKELKTLPVLQSLSSINLQRPGDRMGGWFMSPKAADSANGSCPKEEEDCPDNDDTLFKTPLLRYCRAGI